LGWSGPQRRSGARRPSPSAKQSRPHNLPFVMLGAGILWFGWFGFNSGSALAAGNAASVVVFNTFVATCSALLGWLLVEKLRDGHATSLGGASGAIAGLVAITPACGAVSPLGALSVLVYSFTLTRVITKVLDRTMGLRVSAEAEREGVDVALHAGSAYDLLGGSRGGALQPAGSAAHDPGPLVISGRSRQETVASQAE